jgi:acyl-CoA thioester hydrolase
MLPMDEPVETRLRVRYAETDQMGVVYYGNYFTYFEVGRVEWCRARGFDYGRMEREEGTVLVVAEARCRYRAPARYDEMLAIRTSLKQVRNSVIVFAYQITNADSGQLLASGETTHVITDAQLRPRPIPQAYRALFGVE